MSSDDWVSFSPYGEKSRKSTATIAGMNRNLTTFSSDSDGWPLDEILNDLEEQIEQSNTNIVSMARQMEDIEVVLSNNSIWQSNSRSLSSRSQSSSMSKTNTNLDLTRENKRTTDIESCDRDCNVGKQPRNHSTIRVLERRPERTSQDSDIRFPSGMKIVAHEMDPPSQILKSHYSRKMQEISSKHKRSKAELNLPTHVNGSASTSPKLNQSHLTWDESMSSQRSTSSNDDISALDDPNLSDKSSAIYKIRIIKFFLVFLAAALLTMIGLLVGERVQLNYSQSKSDPSAAQQAEQPPVSPVLVPTDTTIGTNTPKQSTEEKNGNQNTKVEEYSEDLYPEDSPANLPSSEEKFNEQLEGSIQSPSDVIVVQEPITVPTLEPIENSFGTKDEFDEQNSVAPETGYDYTVNTDFLVGVYYYPWHGERFHNRDGYMRKELKPPHVPALGEYNDSDPGVIAHHMKWFRQSNIGLLVTSWWGPNRLEDSNTKDVILEHQDIGNLKIALHYETTSRLGTGREKLPNAKTDIQYMCENYFDHPNYYKIEGRPVLFVYISRKLQTVGTLEEALLTMRSTASKCGHNLYLIGDVVFESAPDPNESYVPFWYFDAVTNYDVYGSSGRPEGYAGTDGVEKYYRQQADWREQALRDDCRYVPAVSPGYNDRGVRMERDHPPLSRRLTSTSQEGSLFHYQLKQAKELVDPKVENMILVNSFNEWHEDTQIEPVTGDISSLPYNFTKGLEYEGYGELYLNILGSATSRDKTRHSKYDYLL